MVLRTPVALVDIHRSAPPVVAHRTDLVAHTLAAGAHYNYTVAELPRAARRGAGALVPNNFSLICVQIDIN